MPVTIRSAEHPARVWGGITGNVTPASSPEELLEKSCEGDHKLCKRVIQSSFENIKATNIFPYSNGFVDAVVEAYNHHHHLTIRPDDVWLTILTQLNYYINAHSEELRSFFVAHEGQKELQVDDISSTLTADFGEMARHMTKEMQKNIVLPELREWIMPDFSTTTCTDSVTAAIVMMGTMQKYFKFYFCLWCGIPSITLLGTRNDWDKLRRRLDFLPRLGIEPTQFASLLAPVLNNFVRSFDEPAGPDTVSFWSKITHYKPFGSGSKYLAGWITAFCFWSAEGKSLYYPELSSNYPKLTGKGNDMPRGYRLDGVLYHYVDILDIPAAHVSVPVTVNDNGTEYKTRMVAGLVGVEVSSSGDPLEEIHLEAGLSRESPSATQRQQRGKAAGLDSVRPCSGWWIYELSEDDSDGTEAESTR
ncbi:hypothetical protein F5Y08DRAFT_339509 [Xylaria arbuscula]|uniref:DUF4419 domain-containing protein n=1 Tax=Xylaria arbuscula TaxID=114810 RepID=A0A9W8TQN5_9PEZI|nr:hypothetical protein F5Y08DRAFT_339509 [Xylaria arbuscula]KAJ3579653.1 hypothetical protein NPX13_g911 [Xylaria arbuscula]